MSKHFVFILDVCCWTPNCLRICFMIFLYEFQFSIKDYECIIYMFFLYYIDVTGALHEIFKICNQNKDTK